MKELNLATKTIPELKQLKNEVEILLEQKIETARADAEAQIREISEQAGLSIMIRGPRKKREVKPKTYRHPNIPEVTWKSTSGTAMPKWLKDFKKQGRSLADFEVIAQAA